MLKIEIDVDQEKDNMDLKVEGQCSSREIMIAVSVLDVAKTRLLRQLEKEWEEQTDAEDNA